MRRLSLIVLLATLVVMVSCHVELKAPVPLAVWGYVYMPDGSPASGAKVTVYAGGVSKSTTTGSNGKYKVDLAVPKTPVDVKVVARKGEYKGSASRKNVEGVVRIDVRLKKPVVKVRRKSTKLTLEVSRKECPVNETVILIGKIEPSLSVDIDIIITRPDGEVLRVKVTSDKRGEFVYELKVDVVGTWSAYARFPGTKDYAPSTSNTVEFHVKYPTTISMKAEAVGTKEVCIVGRVEPPTANATVVILISLDGGMTWLPLCNVTTDENGYFKLSLNMSVSGLLLFKAIFAGTEKLLPAEVERPAISKLPSKEELERRKKVEVLEREKERLENQVKELSEENKSLRAKIEELSQTILKLEEELELYKNQTQELQEETSKLTLELEESKRKLSFYTTTTFTGIPISILVGVLIGILTGKRIKL